MIGELRLYHFFFLFVSLDCAMDVDQADQGSEGGSGGRAAMQSMRGASGHRKKGTDKKKKLWKVEFSKVTRTA